MRADVEKRETSGVEHEERASHHTAETAKQLQKKIIIYCKNIKCIVRKALLSSYSSTYKQRQRYTRFTVLIKYFLLLFSVKNKTKQKTVRCHLYIVQIVPDIICTSMYCSIL